MLLQFLDFAASDFTITYPGIKPGVGGVWFLRWDQWNPGKNEYNTSIVRNWLAAEAKNTLQDGTAKPLIAFLFTHDAPDETNAQGMDWSPSWVKAITPSLTATAANGTTAKMPAYNNTIWWGYLADAVKALAIELDGQPQVSYVAIGHGCDGELWPMKAPWNAKMPGGTERTFGLETVKLLDVYRAAFTKTPLVVRATPGSGRKTFITEAIKRGIGYQFCGMQAAAQNAHGWGNEYGTWDGMADAHAAGLPTIAETTSGLGNARSGYWAILGMLGAGHVDAMDVHPEWLTKIGPDVWDFATRHMGVTAETAPGAWCVLRDYDTKYPPVQWTGSNGVVSGQSDWPGDYQFFMARISPDSDAPRVEDRGPTDAPESRQCRLVTRAEFSVDDAFAAPPYEVAIRWLQEPDKWIEAGDGTMFSTGSGTWQTSTLTVNARQFTVTGNGVAVHMVYVKATEPEPPPPDEPDWAAMTALLNQAQGCIDAARADLDDATAELAELRAMMAEEQE